MQQLFDTNEIKQIDLVAFCEQNGFRGYRRMGSGAMFFSPFRDEREQSFQVSYYKGSWSWKDWGSGEGGDIISLVMAMDNCSFVEACQGLCGNSYEFRCEIAKKKEKDENEKAGWVRQVYIGLLKRPSGSRIARYFKERGVAYHLQMGAVIYRDPEGYDYVGIPLPNPFEISGLECRGHSEHRRKTLGHKGLWVLKRDSKRVLVTESILDALAGERLLGVEKDTLISINGVTNAQKFIEYYKKEKPKEILLALDNDEPGQKARREIENALRWQWCRVKVIQNHEKAGVKDLYRLLSNH